MDKVRIAVIGVGDMGSHHAMGFDRIPECEVRYICDFNEENIARTMKEITNGNPIISNDYRELLAKDDIDAVIISVPNYLHKQVAVSFLEAGKHVFLEKPIAHTLEDCNAILEAAERSGKVMQIGLVYRYSNLYRRMKKELKQGRLGQVNMMWCKEFRDPFPPVDWFYDSSKSGGTLIEKDCHHFDLFNWMIDSKPVRVFASGGQHVMKNGEPSLIKNSYTHYPAKEISTSSIIDHAWVIVDYANGSKANLGLCMYLTPKNLMEEGLEIGLIGGNGTQMIAKKDRTIGIFGGEDYTKEHLDIDTRSDSLLNGHTGGQTQRIDFIACILTGKKPFASGEVGKDALLIALAAEKSILEERYVYIDELK
jgi:predicted dehydrogenase